MDPYSVYGSGYTKLLNTDPIRIRIHNTVQDEYFFDVFLLRFSSKGLPPFWEKKKQLCDNYKAICVRQVYLPCTVMGSWSTHTLETILVKICFTVIYINFCKIVDS